MKETSRCEILYCLWTAMDALVTYPVVAARNL